MLQFQVSITKKEYKKISIQFLLKRLWLIKIIIPVILFNFLFSLLMEGLSSDYFLSSGLMPLLVILLFCTIFYFSLNSIVEKAYQNSPALNETIIYTVDENGVNIEGDSFHTSLQWSRFNYIWVKGDFILLLQTAAFGNFIPTRNLSSEQLEQLLQYAQNANVKIKGIKK